MGRLALGTPREPPAPPARDPPAPRKPADSSISMSIAPLDRDGAARGAARRVKLLLGSTFKSRLPHVQVTREAVSKFRARFCVGFQFWLPISPHNLLRSTPPPLLHPRPLATQRDAQRGSRSAPPSFPPAGLASGGPRWGSAAATMFYVVLFTGLVVLAVVLEVQNATTTTFDKPGDGG